MYWESWPWGNPLGELRPSRFRPLKLLVFATDRLRLFFFMFNNLTETFFSQIYCVDKEQDPLHDQKHKCESETLIYTSKHGNNMESRFKKYQISPIRKYQEPLLKCSKVSSEIFSSFTVTNFETLSWTVVSGFLQVCVINIWCECNIRLIVKSLIWYYDSNISDGLQKCKNANVLFLRHTDIWCQNQTWFESDTSNILFWIMIRSHSS